MQPNSPATDDLAHIQEYLTSIGRILSRLPEDAANMRPGTRSKIGKIIITQQHSVRGLLDLIIDFEKSGADTVRISLLKTLAGAISVRISQAEQKYFPNLIEGSAIEVKQS